MLIGLIRAEHWQTAWVRARVRSELLRREPFLFRARVGPYLSSSTTADLERRLRLLNTEVTPVDQLLESQDAGVPWRDALEDRHGDPPEASFESEYLNGRVRDQRDWYALRSARHSMLDGRYEGWAFACLAAGFALAAFHLRLLVSGKHPAREITLAVEIAAVVLPPAGACLLAIRTHVESHRLARSYEIQARELTEVEQRLMALPAAGNPTAERRRLLLLKRLVLRTEELFTQEFRQWMLILEPGDALCTPLGSF